MKILLFILLSAHFGFGQEGKIISGFVIDEEGNPVIFEPVRVFRIEGERQISVGSEHTDFDGFFQIESLESEVYGLKIISTLYDTLVINGIDLTKSDRINLDSIQLIETEREIVIPNYTVPPIDPF